MSQTSSSSDDSSDGGDGNAAGQHTLTPTELFLKDKYEMNLPDDFFEWLEKMGYPYIRTVDEVKHIAKRGMRREFCVAKTYHPSFVDAVCYNACFPMSIPVGVGHGIDVQVMSPKLHQSRSILWIDQMKVEKGTVRRSKKYTMTLDRHFNLCCKMCVAQHSRNWLCVPLERAFTEMFLKKGVYRTHLHSFEVWNGEKLVACELGYACGQVYTSLTGARLQTESGAGMVQLCVTGVLLRQAGFKLWDFGMGMDYKAQLGAVEMPRKQWLATQKDLRGHTPEPGLSFLERTSAHAILVEAQGVAGAGAAILVDGLSSKAPEQKPSEAVTVPSPAHGKEQASHSGGPGQRKGKGQQPAEGQSHTAQSSPGPGKKKKKKKRRSNN